MNNKKILIIAEAGVNHNGSLDNAKKLIDVAKESGADIVKFQTAKLDSLVSKSARMAEYQKKNIGVEKSQKDMLKDLILSFDDFRLLAEYCRSVGIMFLSTPFDIDSIHFLDELQDIWKVPSGEITNYPYLVEIGKTGKKIILSTGMCTMDEVSQALDVLTASSAGDITLLHCTTDYPTKLEDVNLNAMLSLQKQFNLPVGYSDHTQGILVSVAAAAMGAAVIEKHFTLDRSMPGPDHKASLEPDELKSMVKAIRDVERAKGSFEKAPTEAELKNREVARKSIVAARNIKAGETFTPDNITTKRPGTGLSPMLWNSLMGQKALRAYEEDDLIDVTECEV